jgi:hypothetical protein
MTLMRARHEESESPNGNEGINKGYKGKELNLDVDANPPRLHPLQQGDTQRRSKYLI